MQTSQAFASKDCAIQKTRDAGGDLPVAGARTAAFFAKE
jgi:hypothetical protein